MKYYADNELSAKEWMEIFGRLKKNNPDVFFILYGGEPFLYNELADLLVEMHKEEMNYTIISNNAARLQTKIFNIAGRVGKFKGFTSSVDPWVAGTNKEDVDDHILQKSFDGLSRLTQMKKDNIADDIVAEITCDSRNIHLLYDTVSLLTGRGIWSSITMIDKKKTNYYDFASEFDDSYLVKPTIETRSYFDKVIKSKTPLLVHIPQLLDTLYSNLPCDMMCEIYKDIHNVTISPDGNFRLCLRIRGIEIPKCKLDDLFTSAGVIKTKFNKDLHMDYMNWCNGCNWTCTLMSRYYSDKVSNHVD
jgi:hypothetical protein